MVNGYNTTVSPIVKTPSVDCGQPTAADRHVPSAKTRLYSIGSLQE
jgi:hypothetical protein